MNPARETALVTGASSGIGEALAGCFARGGFALVLVARSVDKLQALAARLRDDHGVKVTVIGADLSLPDAAATLAATLRRRRIAVDVLVNNAGVLEQGRFDAIPPARQRAMIELNVLGLTTLLAELLPPMLRRGRGRVLNVASIAAFQPIPTLATYAATKAYVLSLTESLAEELAGSGVTVTALCPGITATQMLRGATRANPALAKLPSFVIGDVQTVAEQGYEACMSAEVIVVPGALNLAATWASRATPKWLLRMITGVVARRGG